MAQQGQEQQGQQDQQQKQQEQERQQQADMSLENAVTPGAVLEMAQYLDIDVDSEWDLLWLARECLVEPLPPNWEVRTQLYSGQHRHRHTSTRVASETAFARKLIPNLSRYCITQEIISEQGQPQFIDHTTGQVADTHPSDDHFRQALREIRAAGPRTPDSDAEWMAFPDENDPRQHYWYNWM
jgi:hypothetical protein